MGLVRFRVLCISAVVAVLAAGACTYEPEDVVPQIPANAQSSKIFSSDGTLITTLHGDQNRVEVPLDQIPLVMQHAVIAIEDERFYEHPGIDVRALVRAARRNADAGQVEQGGSTITQQLIKQTLLDSGRTLSRKLQEASLAFELERRYSKDKILTIYLNTIYFGNGAYGVEAAAETYFGKPVRLLTAGEAATIAGLIQAPSAFDPLRNPEGALSRRNIVLKKMAELAYLGAADHDAAVASPLGVAPTPTDQRYAAPHFVDEVKRFVLNDRRFGATIEARQKRLFDGGLRIYTTIDLKAQAAAEQAVAEVLPDASDPEAALVAIDPRTGFVRAMVGGRDYFGDSASAKCNLAIGCKPQPGRGTGSAFKPIVLATALAQGVPLSEVLPAPGCISLPVPGTDQTWTPCNADPGEGAPGGTNLVEGTVHSFNTLYAQLILQVGTENAVTMAKRLGITTPLQAVPSAVLGSNDATVQDMASVYGTFANRGVHVPPSIVTKITTADGSILYQHEHEQAKVLDSGLADTVSSVLTQVIERGTGTGAKLDRPAAGKTGTGQDYKNAWFCGYTPELATAVWVGFPLEEVKMSPPNTRITVYGGTWPAAIWKAFMTNVLAGVAPRDFVAPTTTTTTTLPTATTSRALGAPTPVPAVAGKPVEEATTALKAAGFAVDIAPVVGTGKAAGTVTNQSPGAGASAPSGSTVVLEVEAGAAASGAIPTVIGMTTAQATATLRDAGFVVSSRQEAQAPDLDPTRKDKVWKQSPAAGSTAARGSIVIITSNPP
jgi:penicillin-binding protein 1A